MEEEEESVEGLVPESWGDDNVVVVGVVVKVVAERSLEGDFPPSELPGLIILCGWDCSPPQRCRETSWRDWLHWLSWLILRTRLLPLFVATTSVVVAVVVSINMGLENHD